MSTLTISQLETPIGSLTIAVDHQNRIVICEFSDHDDRVARQLARFYQGHTATKAPLQTAIANAFSAYFGGDPNALDGIVTDPVGTEFEKRVWAWLREIPSGATTSYGDMASALGSSPRAVGRANGRNPVALIHPCHRVIGADGSLTGYAGGLERKEWLLQHEGALLPL